jgi:hypothetical protein
VNYEISHRIVTYFFQAYALARFLGPAARPEIPVAIVGNGNDDDSEADGDNADDDDGDDKENDEDNNNVTAQVVAPTRSWSA